MAKRARGTTRPGQRRPIQRAGRALPGRPPAGPPPEGLSDVEVARAADLESALVASEHAEQPTTSRRTERDRPRATEDPLALRRRPTGPSRLAAEAAEEYRYVARDVRRIALIGGSMFGILAVLYVILEVAGVAQH